MTNCAMQSTDDRSLIFPRYSGAEALVTMIARQAVRDLLLDWDGCMTPVSGTWHGLIALESLRRSPAFCAHASATLDEAIKAYEGPGHGIDWFALFQQNLVMPKLSHLPNVEEVLSEVMGDLRRNVPVVAGEFESGRFAQTLTIPPNPGVNDFLALSKSAGLDRIVVTMTPTPIVKAFAARSGLAQWISDYHGCETFSHFPETKADPQLWLEAADRGRCPVSEIAVVEDSKRSLRGALLCAPAVVISMTAGVEELRDLVSPATQMWVADTSGDMNSVKAFHGS